MVLSAESAAACSIDVKTNSKRANFWLVGKHAKKISSRSHFYVFINITTTRDGGDHFDYYVVPSRVVKEKTDAGKSKRGLMYFFRLPQAVAYRNKWRLLGTP
jgi:hypothetical protein